MNLGNMLSMLSQSGVLESVQKPQSSTGDAADLLGALLGGGQAQTSGGDVGGLLGSLLGGAQPQQSGAQSPAGDVMGMLGSLLGGAQPQAAAAPSAGAQDGADALLPMLLSLAQSPAASSFIQPMVAKIADKFGIPPQTALVVVTFVIQYLISNYGHKVAEGIDLDGDGKADELPVKDLSAQLVAQTGMDSKTATRAVTEVFNLLDTTP